jgi:basic membrane protein A
VEATTLRLTATEREFIDAAVARRRAAEAAEEQRRAAESRLRRGTRRRTWALAGAIAALVGVVGAVLLTPGESSGPTVGLFGFDRTTGGNIDQLSISGLERAARDRNFEPVLVGTALADPAGALGDLGDASDLVIVGLVGTEVLTPEIVAAHPDATWVVLDPPSDPFPGVSSFSFAVHEGSFLVGAAAALESQTGVVGFVGGQQVPHIEAFRAGFEAGARAADPEVEVLAGYVVAGRYGGYSSPDLADDLATSMYQRGADVVFHAAGESGLGVFEAADRTSDVLGRKLWAIGVDNDEYLNVPGPLRDHVLTSMVKRFDLGVYETVRSFLDGELAPGNRTFTLADGGVGFSTSGDHLADSTIARVQAFEDEIASGARVVPHVPSGALDPPLDAASPVPIRVTWDGASCTVDAPPELHLGDMTRLDIANATSADAQVWARPPEVAFPLVGVEVPPGGQATAWLEVREGLVFGITCYPLRDGRPAVAEGVTSAALVIVDTS